MHEARMGKRWEPPTSSNHLPYTCSQHSYGGALPCPACKPALGADEVKGQHATNECDGGCNEAWLHEPAFAPQLPHAPMTGAPAMKNDQGKLRYDLTKPYAVSMLVAVLTHGAAKYDDDNWLKVLKEPGGPGRYYAAMMRHVEAWRAGQDIDEDSGLPHLAHAMACVMFLLEGSK